MFRCSLETVVRGGCLYALKNRFFKTKGRRSIHESDINTPPNITTETDRQTDTPHNTHHTMPAMTCNALQVLIPQFKSK